ncbi:MarR family winged helix-turn-helix transcriptional regulator [Paenibacillus sacheonensis]|uniref:MarR family transcriptional regulator n=1 Tax=Paenibacillus sacheonensis TaxID=742054 RepID=A0A7X4YUX4_9BACL|nr:MarR family winged helix-turn-helix transcriptional regulator [Paenibacillus sacheonensis]MBM7569486.1 DNA-binding MarR family transcriptional regulator [Paenibacillus sacheonensis]NBC71924.1 MarR family transcriptional regulator [Paenibacillus sacheonensis]
MTENKNERLDIIDNVFRANVLLERIGHNLSSQAGLSSLHQWFILIALARVGDQSFKDLGNNMLVTKQNMTGMVQRLKQNGFVATYESPHDRRVTKVSITAEGQEALANVNAYSVAKIERAFEGFSSDEVASFGGYLERMIENMKKEE